MYSLYAYTNTATLANVIKDIGAVLAGETNKANLSVGCDQTNTSISTAYDLAGWAEYDPAAHNAGTCTVSIASPCVVTLNGHGMAANEPVAFTTSGALPTGLAAGTTYYVLAVDANTFNVSATSGGAAINTSGSQSGTHTLWTSRKQVFRAACSDDAGLYKYAILDYSAAGYLNLTMAEGWNTATKAATNQTSAYATTGTAAAAQRINIGGANARMRIFASARKLVFQSSTAAGTGAETTNTWIGIFERDRASPWDTAGAGYLPAVLMSGYAMTAYNITAGCFSFATKYKTLSGDLTGASATVRTAVKGFCSNTNSSGIRLMASQVQRYKTPDGAGGLYCPFTDLSVASAAGSFLGGSVSARSDVWIPPLYANLDRTTYNGKVYMFLQNTYDTNNDGCLAVPMG